MSYKSRDKFFLALIILFIGTVANCNDLNQKEFKFGEFQKYIEEDNSRDSCYIKSMLFKKWIKHQKIIEEAMTKGITSIKNMLNKDPLTTLKLLTERDYQGNTLLHHAIKNDVIEVFKIILKSYFELEVQNNLYIEDQMFGDDLVNNIKNSSINSSNFIVDPLGLILLSRNNNNESPLDLVLKSKNLRMLTELLNSNQSLADYILNSKNSNGKKLSELALELDNDKYMYGILLFQHYKHNNIEQIISSKDNSYKESLLHIALKNNKPKIFKLILNIINHLKLINLLNIKDNNNKTILDIAKEKNINNLVKRIEEIQLNITT